MKKIIYWLIMAHVSSTLMLTGCNRQPKKSVTINQNKRFTKFEERQKQDLKNRKMVDNFLLPSGSIFRYAASKATKGVVHIKSVFPANIDLEFPDLFKDFFGEDFFHRFSPDQSPGKQLGSASGVLVTTNGYIVTNNHVVNQAESIEVVLHDQRSYKAQIIGTDPATDLALLKISEKDLPFIEFGNSDSLAVGDFVLAVGNPFNLASTVTAGIVSAKARNINLLTDRWAVESYIQTDAAMNPGNSGGALVDINGKLIGITAAIASPTGAYAGYSFAIPIEIVKKSINDLLRYGKVLHGYLGIMITDMNAEKAKMLGINETTGAIVDSLEKNSPAMKAGIQRNDVIKKIGINLVETANQLREFIARAQPREKLQLTVIRNGKEKVISVLLTPVEEPFKAEFSASEILKTLGIEVANLSEQEKNRLQIPGGVKITSVRPGKISSQTDIKTGFIIVKINEKPVNSAKDFFTQLQRKKGKIMLEGIYPDSPVIYYYAFGM